jgi:ankyrin repeat protein
MDLIREVRNGNLPGVLQLIRAGVDVNFVNRNERDMTPLHYAARAGNVQIGLALIGAGADINAVDGYNDTPLTIAAHVNNKDFVVLLLEQDNIKLDNAVVAAVKANNVETINLLLDSGANPNGDNGGSPLMTAVSLYAPIPQILPVIKTLLGRGADVNFQKPILEAIRADRLPIVKLLLEAPDIDVDTRDDNGSTLLYVATEWNTPAVVDLLINAGADPTIRNNEGKTPYDIAGSPTLKFKLKVYQDEYAATKVKSRAELSQRAMIQRRMTTGVNFPSQLQLPQRQLPQHIFTRSIYDELCTQLSNKNTRPQLQELAKSLGITPGTKSKAALCQAIWEKLTL